MNLFKATLIIILSVASVILGIFTMMFGWGLEAKSWTWIIGGPIAGALLLSMISVVAESK